MTDIIVMLLALAGYLLLFVLAVRIANKGGKEERERNEKLRAERAKKSGNS